MSASNDRFQNILEESKRHMHYILATNKASNMNELLSIVHQITNSQDLCVFPYFIKRNMVYESPFASFWIKRFTRRGLFQNNPFSMTQKGISSVPTTQLSSIPDPETINFIFPYSEIPPESISLGSNSFRIRPNIGDIPVLLTTLLPPKPEFFLIFSHFDKDGMRTTYPIWKEDDLFFSLFMGDVRNVFSVPKMDLLENCWQNFTGYLDKYVSDFQKYLKIILNLFLSISRIRYTHICGSRPKLLNKLTDEIKEIIDFSPNCTDCCMTTNNCTNSITLRNKLAHSWSKSVLSELFFSKLVAHEMNSIDSNIKVYPRLVIENVPHEIDIFVKSCNKIIIFELKRSNVIDSFCKEGIKQLSENKRFIEKCGLECKTVLVSNMNSRNLPTSVEINGKKIKNEIDEHLIPEDIFNLKSILESLV